MEENKNYSNIDKNQLFQNTSSAVDVFAYPLSEIESDDHGHLSIKKLIEYNPGYGGENDGVINDPKCGNRSLQLNYNDDNAHKANYEQTEENKYQTPKDGKFLKECFNFEHIPSKETEVYCERCQNVGSGCESVGLHNRIHFAEENKRNKEKSFPNYHTKGIATYKSRDNEIQACPKRKGHSPKRRRKNGTYKPWTRSNNIVRKYSDSTDLLSSEDTVDGRYKVDGLNISGHSDNQSEGNFLMHYIHNIIILRFLM